MISKKDLLKKMNISYGQLYRWKREELIPENWFMKLSVSSGQETFFEEELIIPRIKKILELKDKYSLEELKDILNGTSNLNLNSISSLQLLLIHFYQLLYLVKKNPEYQQLKNFYT